MEAKDNDLHMSRQYLLKGRICGQKLFQSTLIHSFLLNTMEILTLCIIKTSLGKVRLCMSVCVFNHSNDQVGLR